MLFLTLSIVCIPFLLVVLWKNRIIGVAVMIPVVTLMYVMLGIGLQALGLFTRPIVLSIHSVFAIGTLVFLYTKRAKIMKPIRYSIGSMSILMVMCAIGIVLYQLYAVHFSYTGIVSTIRGEEYVVDSAYPYPLYSDEWISVAMVKQMSTENSLPFTHPFTGASYNNFLFIFQILIAHLSVLIGGTLTTTYVWLGIGVNMLIVLMMLLWWRAQKISWGIATLGVLLVPYIANSSNLPMLWYVLPWNVGFLLLLCGYVLMRYQQKWLAIGACVTAVMVYPPYIVFIIPILFVYTRSFIGTIRRRTMYTLVSLAIGAPLVFMMLVSMVTTLSFSTVAQKFFSIMVRPLNSSAGLPPTFFLWHVLPYITIPFALYAAYRYQKELRLFLVPIALGLLWWMLNGLVDITVLIDYHRVVNLTSLLIFMISIVGMQAVWAEVSKKITIINASQVQIVICGVMLMCFLILVPGYTTRDGWRVFTTTVRDSDGLARVHAPASPVNRYVHPDDLRIFETLSEERFLSVGWKGLVLGVLTDNIPVFTKPSTITVNAVPYVRFMTASCHEKMSMLQKAQVSYVYIPKIECDGFEIVDKSAEGLYLMRVVSL